MSILPGIGAGIGILGGIADIGANIGNYANQRSALNWQKQAQYTTWEREDNAVQRRIDDLRKAGLSGTLAAGSAAATSAPVKITAPELKPTFSNSIAGSLELMRGMKDISRTNAEISLIKAQADKAKADARLANHNAGYYEDKDIPSNASAVVKTIHGLNDSVEEIIKTGVANLDTIATEGINRALAYLGKEPLKGSIGSVVTERMKGIVQKGQEAGKTVLEVYLDIYDSLKNTFTGSGSSSYNKQGSEEYKNKLFMEAAKPGKAGYGSSGGSGGAW